MPLLYTIRKIFGGRILTEDGSLSDLFGGKADFLFGVTEKNAAGDVKTVCDANKPKMTFALYQDRKKELAKELDIALKHNRIAEMREAEKKLRDLEKEYFTTDAMTSGWYIVDDNDRPVDGPFSESVGKAKAEKDGKECIYFSEYSLRRAQGEDAAAIFTAEEAQSIAERAGIDLAKYDADEFRKGLGVELEHSDLTAGDPSMTAKIALAHLREIPDYYTRLEKMESGAQTQDAGSSVPIKEVYQGYAIKGPANTTNGIKYLVVTHKGEGWAETTTNTVQEAKAWIDSHKHPSSYVGTQHSDPFADKKTKDSGYQTFYKGYEITVDGPQDEVTLYDKDGEEWYFRTVAEAKKKVDQWEAKKTKDWGDYLFDKGQKVKIRRGPMQGQKGIVIKRKGASRVVRLESGEEVTLHFDFFVNGEGETKDAMRMTNDPGERGKQKEMLRGLYPDYDPKHHDAFVARYNKEEDKKNTAEYMKNRGISDNKTKDCKTVKQRFRDAIKRMRDAKSDYITAVDPNGKEMEVGESMAEALVQSGVGKWSSDHKKVLLNKSVDKKTTDGGVGSGVKGHVTAKQLTAMKNRATRSGWKPRASSSEKSSHSPAMNKLFHAYPNLQMPKSVFEELRAQGMNNVEEQKGHIVISSAYADFHFDKKTGKYLKKTA